MNAIETALRRLANNMRLYGEAHLRYSDLAKVDSEEAIENVDRAFEAVLEAFHTLYDVSGDLVEYFEHADTTLLIALRNALHHRDHPLFHSLLSQLWLSGDPERWLGAKFLLAGHGMLAGNRALMTHYVKLDDIYARLDPKSVSPHRDTFLKGERAAARMSLVESGLALGAIRERARQKRYPSNQVYLDMVPILISAVSRAFIALQAAGVGFNGYDANAYKDTFTSELRVDLQSAEFSMVSMTNLQIFVGPKLSILQMSRSLESPHG
ncbi:hypothetical protein [Cupriavidus campinensis]|uniref:hypothetical protein n=1 Tax=Cupriavidus campinensis TaxID=151783 RepID=UPI0024E22C49|nr:hypothetical protein [Cupriavidus campinensis]